MMMKYFHLLEKAVPLHIVCHEITHPHSVQLHFNTTTSQPDYYLSSPLSNHTYTYPVYHCTQGQTCPENMLLVAPPTCTFYTASPLPSGFSLLPDGTIVCDGTAVVLPTEVTVMCDEEDLQIPVTVSVGGM